MQKYSVCIIDTAGSWYIRILASAEKDNVETFFLL